MTIRRNVFVIWPHLEGKVYVIYLSTPSFLLSLFLAIPTSFPYFVPKQKLEDDIYNVSNPLVTIDVLLVSQTQVSSDSHVTENIVPHEFEEYVMFSLEAIMFHVVYEI